MDQFVLICFFSIRENHAEIQKDGDKFLLKAIDDAKVLINGEPCTGQIQLQHKDRYVLV